MNTHNLTSVQSVRYQLLQVLIQLTHSQSPTESTVTGWLNSLANIVASYSSPYEQLSVQLIEESLSLLNEVIFPAITSVGTIDVTSQTIQTALNGIVDGCSTALARINFQNQLTYSEMIGSRRLIMSNIVPVNNSVVSMLQQVQNQYANLILSVMVAGQSDVDVILSQTRISCQYQVSGSNVIEATGGIAGTGLNVRTLTLPLTSGEQMSNVPANMVSLTFPQTANAVKLAIVSLNLLNFDNSSSVKAAGDTYTANPISLYLADVSICGSNDCEVYMQLFNTEVQVYENTSSYEGNRSTFCFNGTVVGHANQVTEQYMCGDTAMTSSCAVDSAIVGSSNLHLYWRYYHVFETCPIPLSYPVCSSLGNSQVC